MSELVFCLRHCSNVCGGTVESAVVHMSVLKCSALKPEYLPPPLPLASKARGQMHCQIVEVYYIEFKVVMTQ